MNDSPSAIFVAACWLIWAAVWFASSRGVKPVIEQQSARSRAAYSVLLFAAFLLLLADSKSLFGLNVHIIPHTRFVPTIGASVCVLGTSFTLWARLVLAGNWSAVVTFKKDHELIQHGPYRMTRHPIYTGMLLMFLGAALVSGTIAPFLGLVLSFISFWIKLNQEEKLLLAHFPADYPAYQRRVKRIIPFLL